MAARATSVCDDHHQHRLSSPPVVSAVEDLHVRPEIQTCIGHQDSDLAFDT